MKIFLGIFLLDWFLVSCVRKKIFRRTAEPLLVAAGAVPAYRPYRLAVAGEEAGVGLILLAGVYHFG